MAVTRITTMSATGTVITINLAATDILSINAWGTPGSAVTSYLHLFNRITAPTLGTSIPEWVIPLQNPGATAISAREDRSFWAMDKNAGFFATGLLAMVSNTNNASATFPAIADMPTVEINWVPLGGAQ